MEMNKAFYLECNLAGRQYYEVNEVWEELFVGACLMLERDKENRYDPNAIQVIYEDINSVPYLLGYIPSDCNEDLAKFFDMGWGNIFSCRISKISPNNHYENQIRLTISIIKNDNNE